MAPLRGEKNLEGPHPQSRFSVPTGFFFKIFDEPLLLSYGSLLSGLYLSGTACNSCVQIKGLTFIKTQGVSLSPGSTCSLWKYWLQVYRLYIQVIQNSIEGTFVSKTNTQIIYILDFFIVVVPHAYSNCVCNNSADYWWALLILNIEYMEMCLFLMFTSS